MVNRVNSSNPTSAAAVAIGAWQAVMGNHPVAANRRRWAGIIFALMASAILLFQAPTNPALLVRWLFSARSYGHLLAIGLGFFLALRSAASSQQAIFHIEDFKEAQKNLWRSAFGARREPFNIGNDDSKLESSESSFLHMGGPVQIQVNREHLAVFEDYQGSTRVISPRDGETSLRGFEQLRALVETKDQVAIISIWGRTKDGIRVRVDSARIVYSIRRRNSKSGLSDTQPADYDAALRVAYGKRIESGQATNPEYRVTVDDFGRAFFERQMQSFIAGLSFAEILSSGSEKDEKESDGSRALSIKRDMLKDSFASHCEAASQEHGLKAHWVDMGRWTVDELAQEIIDDIQENPLHSSSLSEKASYQDSRAEELNRLYSELAAWDQAKIGAEKALNQSYLLSAYYGLFDGLKLRYAELLGEDEQQIDIVLRFLKVINSGLESKT